MNFSMMNPVNLGLFFYSMAMLLQIYMAQWHPNWYVPFMEIYQTSIRTTESHQKIFTGSMINDFSPADQPTIEK